jgi:uncharacterized membrane protein YfcA
MMTNLLLLLLLGVAAGFLSGLVGVGGGVFIDPWSSGLGCLSTKPRAERWLY